MNLPKQRGSAVRRAKQRRRRVDRIYESLDDRVDLLMENPELQDEILDWQDEVDSLPATNLLDNIESVLTEMETNNEMRRVDLDGASDFPEQCRGCDHYGVACPLFHDRATKIERERLQDELVGATGQEVRQRYRKLAGRVGCHVIVELIEEWEAEFSGLLEQGRDLRRRSNHILRPQDDVEAAAEAAADVTEEDR